MTSDEFQKKYHSYMTDSDTEALADAVKVNEQMTDGHKVVPVKLGDKWCLMLDTAAEAIQGLGF